MNTQQRRVVAHIDRAFRTYEKGLRTLRKAAVEDLKRRLRNDPNFSPSHNRLVRECGKVRTAR